MSVWKTGNPKENGQYLVTTNNGSVKILNYAEDLYKIDNYDFDDMKGKSGWYFYDSEYGYVMWASVIAYMELPKPYERKITIDEEYGKRCNKTHEEGPYDE